MPAIIYGYDQQGNTQPPNMRYFEYTTVAAASATAIATLGSITGGNYTANGGSHTYTSVPLTGGTGSGAIATITVSGNAVTAVTLTSVGGGYVVSDTLSATTASLGGTGTGGFSVPVASVAGIVTFTDPLKNSYDSRWWDTQMSDFGNLYFGAPRIYPLANTAYTNFNFPQLLWIKGATFLANPTYPAADSLQLQGNLVIYEDVTAPAVNLVMSNKAIVKRSTFVGGASGCDKLIDSVSIQDSTIDSLAVATYGFTDCVGVNSLSLIHNKFYGLVQVSPRSLKMSDNDITPGTVNSFAGIYDRGLLADTLGRVR